MFKHRPRNEKSVSVTCEYDRVGKLLYGYNSTKKNKTENRMVVLLINPAKVCDVTSSEEKQCYMNSIQLHDPLHIRLFS